jgi:hypothetical protein
MINQPYFIERLIMNSIQLVAKTITSSQGAKVTLNQLPSEVEKVSLKPTEIMSLVSSVTQSVLQGDNAKTTLESSIETFNKNALALHTGGVRLQDGRSKDKDTMVIRSQFMDETKTLAKNTAQKYYEWFMKVVNTGKPLKSFNDDSKSKKSKGANTEPKEIDTLIASLVNHPKFTKTFSVDAQLEIKEILIKAGYEVAL